MRIKRFLLAIFALITICFAAAASFTPVYATDNDNTENPIGDACSIAGETDPLICGDPDSNEEKELQNRIKNVLETIYLWIGILAVIVIVIGGIRYMLSQGEPEKIKGAKNAITYAIIGLVVTLMAFAITEFFIGALQGQAPSGGGGAAQQGGGNGGGNSGGGGSGNETTEVRAIQLYGLSTIRKGNEYGFTVKVIPDYATDKTIKWKSGDTSVATVSQTGRVKAQKPGTTVITATANNGKTATKTITVPEPILAENIAIVSKPSSVITGKTIQLSANITPRNAENKEITWSTSDKNIITVSKNGLIKGIKKGTATITAKTSNNKSDSAKITVKDNAEIVQNERVKKLQDTVKAYAWPTFKGRNYLPKKDAYQKAYTAATNAGWVSNKDCNGNDCGVFVLITMRNSGWEPNYPNQRTEGQYDWLKDPSHGWEDVTDKIHSNSDAKPGDVIITRGQGHVLLYMGKVDGFASNMASASYCHRSPMADEHTNIATYKQLTNSGKKYSIFRKKNR